MPYTPRTAPSYVKAQLSGSKLRQWCDVWNSSYEACLKTGKSASVCEGEAFPRAHSVAGVSARG